MVATAILIVLSGLGSLLGLWVFYWVVRAAVRHGIEDAWRRRAQRSADEAG
jgi:membrane protein DedA with SNARE-associated domain